MIRFFMQGGNAGYYTNCSSCRWNAQLLPPAVVHAANIYISNSGLDPLLKENERHRVAYRIFVHGEIIYSSQYGRVKKRNSYTVQYKDMNNDTHYGSVQYFIVASEEIVLAVLHEMSSVSTYQDEFDLSTDELNSTAGAAKVVGDPHHGSVIVTSVKCIQDKCLLIDVGTLNKYVVSFPNKVHLD